MSLSPLRLLLLASLLVYSAGAAQAGWQDRATALDQKRLAALGEARTKALAEANAGGGAGDARAIHEALDARSHAPTVGEVAGSWRCRTIKLGGMTPYVVYSWFKCRVEARGDELRFEKITGSQLTSGVLYPSGDGFVYLGASSVRGEARHAYSGNGATAGAAVTPDDQIGLLTAVDTKHARLELPYPVQESTFDVIELKR